MPTKATILALDSQNPAASPTPLYAVVDNGQFYLLDIEDTPCYTLTADARRALQEKPGEFVRRALKKRGMDTAWMDEV